jgi:hypothetical protein
MRAVGFSTGALAPGDAAAALAALRGTPASAVELSALRLHELAPLLAAIPSLDLSAFAHVSVHAPSRFGPADEPRVAEALAEGLPAAWPVVLHPDTMHDPGVWRRFGPRLLVENMDRRKATGRTLRELGRVFEQLPEASFCFDIGHAHQVDRTMTDAFALIRALGVRLAQIHISEVTSEGRHDPLGRPVVAAFRTVAAWVPEGVPLILEGPAGPYGVEAQLALAREALARPGT